MAENNPIRDALEALGPTNRIARQLVNRLDVAEDALEETYVINGELQEMFDALVELGRRYEAALDELAAEGIEALEDEANRP
jgi:hypothetical protein